ncbi:metal ABC transporter substrate-binding protein [Bacillus sonorensis]|uniref:metal ABC transporter substrate-binding protein n=1 Tax=Bacillus sonorensis TaxID=119858 RepID=UPI0004957C44|nr:metal ABC transporter substrate-binding protein [Bacillus sonorensis]MCF7617132.1 metal ABC transporter substrate-binding protein [Bacillus sonorensis]MCY8033900.1 metal ABC transporter substrate-binding protein [Bacillus sonorensis]MCY8563977.1 metal ABC transporter substrate-binding protein [Bacillus sonorensis]MEC1352521.1 metal ABC transporter substrate-binding protein [Bacillus sonorensis]MEC1427361.1 metal ABC transporter substrate-binding protein [Bacillus sonorensis]
MKKTFGLASAFILAAGLAAGCSSTGASSDQKDNGKLDIYTTIYPLEDFTKKIGGEYVNVKSVYPPNVEAHTYEPSSKTMAEISEADAFIYSGVGVEGFADKAVNTLKGSDVKIVKAGEGIDLLSQEEEHEEHGHEEESAHEEHDHAHDHGEAEEHDHDHGDKDPHVWLDPVLAEKLAENIKDELVKLEPEHKKTFTKNYESLKKDLKQLDQDFKQTVDRADKKEILVSHAAYGYWEKRYGIKQMSVLGLSPTEEPSQKELENIVKTAKEHNIKYVIFESNVSSKISEIIKNEIGAESLTMKNLESISKEDKESGKDYLTIMKENLSVLKKALSN